MRVWTPCKPDKTTRPTPIAYGYNMGCTHINYKRESFVAYYPVYNEIVQISQRVISLKRFRLFSQKVVSFAHVRAGLCETLTKVKDFFNCCMDWGIKKVSQVVTCDTIILSLYFFLLNSISIFCFSTKVFFQDALPCAF